MAKPILILQLRPEDETADGEFNSVLQYGGIDRTNVRRIRMEKEGMPEINLDDFSAVILGGGPYNLSDEVKSPEQLKFEAGLKKLLAKITEADFPYLGACYGISTLNNYLGGEVSKEKYAETVEATTISLTKEGKVDSLLSGLPESFRAFGGHKESCQNLGEDVVLLAGSARCPIHMIRYKTNIYATQFHTELDHEDLALRVRFYKNHGYFPAEEAEDLIAAAEKEDVTTPLEILRRFVQRYTN